MYIYGYNTFELLHELIPADQVDEAGKNVNTDR